MQKTILAALALAIATLVPPAAATGDSLIAQPDRAIASTERGKVQGFIHNGIYSYRGIPYATAKRF